MSQSETALSSQVGGIFQINISDGGVPKLPVEQAEVTLDGLVGDRQKNLKTTTLAAI